MIPSEYHSPSASTPARYSGVFAVNSTTPSRTMRWSLFSGWPPRAVMRSDGLAAKESVRNERGISSALPLPLGSPVLKASSAALYSSIVRGMGRPRASSHFLLIYRKFGCCRIPSSSTDGSV
ncbi:hypothetical protein ACFPRL_28695 [Pseudoclavibacter helvolus]